MTLTCCKDLTSNTDRDPYIALFPCCMFISTAPSQIEECVHLQDEPTSGACFCSLLPCPRLARCVSGVLPGYHSAACLPS